jgi:hypothetical protein
MEVIKDQKFAQRAFVLEDTVFVNCHLKQCDLFYSGGDVEWLNTNFENCRFHWRGAAKNTFGLLLMLKIVAPQQAPPTVPSSVGTKPN